MHIAILTFQGFNELDSLVALGVLNRIKKPDWRVTLCCPEATVTSMNGVVVHAQTRLHDAQSADAVIVGSGIKTREIVKDPEIMSALRLDPARQLIAAQCSGTLVLARLGRLDRELDLAAMARAFEVHGVLRGQASLVTHHCGAR